MSVWIPAAMKGLWDLGSQYFSNKKEVKAAKHVRQLEEIKQGAERERSRAKTLIDEYWMFILSAPMIQLIIAPVYDLTQSTEAYVAGQWTAAVLQGLQALESAPSWYVYSVLTSIFVAYGIKPTTDTIKQALKLKVK